jgi:hypothetical protein
MRYNGCGAGPPRRGRLAQWKSAWFTPRWPGVRIPHRPRLKRPDWNQPVGPFANILPTNTLLRPLYPSPSPRWHSGSYRTHMSCDTTDEERHRPSDHLLTGDAVLQQERTHYLVSIQKYARIQPYRRKDARSIRRQLKERTRWNRADEDGGSSNELLIPSAAIGGSAQPKEPKEREESEQTGRGKLAPQRSGESNQEVGMEV